MEQHQAQLISLPEVLRISGISKSEVWRRVSEGRFPEPVRLGERCTRWERFEVLDWVSARLAERKTAKQAAVDIQQKGV